MFPPFFIFPSSLIFHNMSSMQAVASSAVSWPHTEEDSYTFHSLKTKIFAGYTFCIQNNYANTFFFFMLLTRKIWMPTRSQFFIWVHLLGQSTCTFKIKTLVRHSRCPCWPTTLLDDPPKVFSCEVVEGQLMWWSQTVGEDHRGVHYCPMEQLQQTGRELQLQIVL